MGELKDLKFRCFETVLSKAQKDNLKAHGYYCYDLRDVGGWEYLIEENVTVNNIGNWVTDVDLKPYMRDQDVHPWISINDINTDLIGVLPRAEIIHLLQI